MPDSDDEGEDKHGLGFSPSARYFITVAPVGKLDRGENALTIADGDRIDKLYLESLGLNSVPLLEQLKILRGPSTWRLGMVASII